MNNKIEAKAFQAAPFQLLLPLGRINCAGVLSSLNFECVISHDLSTRSFLSLFRVRDGNIKRRTETNRHHLPFNHFIPVPSCPCCAVSIHLLLLATADAFLRCDLLSPGSQLSRCALFTRDNRTALDTRNNYKCLS